jgi:hypothetical protein
MWYFSSSRNPDLELAHNKLLQIDERAHPSWRNKIVFVSVALIPGYYSRPSNHAQFKPRQKPATFPGRLGRFGGVVRLAGRIAGTKPLL